MVKHTQTICRQLAAHETAMRKKYPYSEFFWSLISRTGTTEYGDLVNLLQSKCVVYVSEKGGANPNTDTFYTVENQTISRHSSI